MMFSPETYALLNGKIEANADQIAARWKKTEYNLGTNFKSQLETAYSAAEEHTAFSNTFYATNGTAYFMCVKDTAARGTSRGFALMTGTATFTIGFLLLERASDGTWTAYRLE